jgi:hypothetical protein
LLILVSGATATHRRFADSRHFGHLTSPRGGNRIEPIAASGKSWACDNDSFSKAGFDSAAFRRMLARIDGLPGCRFVACPDVVCDPVATLARFAEWSPEIVATGQPVAFVGQDGCEDMELPWPDFGAFFVGGSDGWKESKAAMELCERAKSLGKWVHVGRVNTFRRIRKLWDWGAVDSIDGKSFSAWSNLYFPKGIAWIESLERQPTLWGDDHTS